MTAHGRLITPCSVAPTERAKGATLEELMEATGWQAHSVRGFISGTLGKKLKMKSTRFGPRRATAPTA